MANAYNHTEHADRIETSLRALGLVAEADSVRDAVAGGSTGTEIHFRLRAALEQLRKNPRVPKAVKDDAQVLIKECGKALQF